MQNAAYRTTAGPRKRAMAPHGRRGRGRRVAAPVRISDSIRARLLALLASVLELGQRLVDADQLVRKPLVHDRHVGVPETGLHDDADLLRREVDPLRRLVHAAVLVEVPLERAVDAPGRS